MEGSKEKKSGFYTVDAVPLYQSSKKPFHLEKRFKQDLYISSSNKKKQVESKREAILEERRKKLNQNFLKVKRVVNETKNKRKDKINLLAKSMELAEINRNLYIEQRRASSKQVVERAKRIALQNQRRSEQEQERRRAELESRLVKTEERRLAHLNRYKKQQKIPTSSSSSSSSLMHKTTSTLSPPLLPAIAAAAAAAAAAPKKKPSSWSIILSAFKELNLPSPSSPNSWLEFNSLGKLLKQPKVIVVTTKVLNTALKITDENSRHRARVLLTSYMMLMCPKEVLQDVNGVEEKRLHTSAKQMLHLFEFWLRAHGRPGATAARLAFVNAWNDYNLLFENWKSKDCEQLVKNTIRYYVELSTLRQTVIAQQNGDESVGDQLKQQLEEIKTKLEKLGGVSALERLQRSLESASSSTSTGRKKQERINTPRSPLDGQQQQKAQTNPDQMAQLLNGFSQPDLTNEQLAHELIMDPEFKLQPYEPLDELEKRIRLMAEKAFFDKIAEDIENGTFELSLPSLIKEVKSRLLSLVRTGTSVYHAIDEAIDLDLIEQEIRQKTFNMQHMIHYVLDTASSMCAPVRDEQIQQARNTDNMTEQLKQVFHILDAMSMDLANFKLRSLRPHLLSISVEFEREKFAKMLNDGTIQLVHTKTWLHKSVDTLCHVAAQRNPERVPQQQAPQKLTHDAVYENALVSLLSQSKPITSNTTDFPETLALDRKRVAEFQNEVQAITIVAALLMLAKNFGSANAQTLSDLAATLFTMLQQDASTTSIDHLAAEIQRAVNVKPERREMVRTMVDKTVSHSDTVYSLLLRRVAMVIKSTIQNGSFVTDAVLTSNGLEHVRTNLQALAVKIQRLARHNKKVYATWYDDIIKEALTEKNTEEAAYE